MGSWINDYSEIMKADKHLFEKHLDKHQMSTSHTVFTLYLVNCCF